MPYITREDGEHFVIPSYRDVLSAKNKNLLKKDILLLSQNYGEYITMQRKSPTQYEVAFSPDTGYLLGESIWHNFKRPMDMIYCEAIPNTTEAILVIVKAGSVYLDGSFPLDSIPEELIIFLTQKNNFEIYIYGDVPISETPQEGKFSFEPSSVKSFAVLDKPVFPTLPLLKIYQLQLVDVVLKSQGIGVLPIRQLLLGIVFLGLLYFLYSWFTSVKPEVPLLPSTQANPYQGYLAALTSPAPAQEINNFLGRFSILYTMPGWTPAKVEYAKGILTAAVKSNGGRIEQLTAWAGRNGARIEIMPDGIYIVLTIDTPTRPPPTKIYSLKNAIAKFIDGLGSVYPGNHIDVGSIKSMGNYTDMLFTVNVENVSPVVLSLIGTQFKDLPFVLQKLSLTITDGNLSGSLSLEALGS